MLILNTGPLVAAADRGDQDHEACLRLLSTSSGPLVVSPLVVAEAAYLIGRQLGPPAEAEFFRSISDGELLLEVLTSGDLTRMLHLVESYANLGLGGTDAKVHGRPGTVLTGYVLLDNDSDIPTATFRQRETQSVRDLPLSPQSRGDACRVCSWRSIVTP